MLYPKSREDRLSTELFKTPTKEYRGAPFWAWNTKVTKEHIENTLIQLQEMGMGGAHIHSRTGMNIPYLSEEFMELVKYTHDFAKEKGMLTWLYDEDRWPSGAAGGLVTKEEQYRIRFLVFSPMELPENEIQEALELEASAKAIRSGKRSFLGKYEVRLEQGYLKDYEYISKEQEAREGYDSWYAYLEISGGSPWFNNQAYLNTLDKAAVKQFIAITHEAYADALGDSFGDTVPAIFTDEPQFSPKSMLGFSDKKEMLTLPYTDDFEDSFQNAYGDSFLLHLPEIFWDMPEHRISVHRYRYHDHLCERFTEAFADTIGQWCKNQNILLSGHMMREPSLFSQTSYLGEAMRSYRSFGIPGIDMLCDRRELTTAKQAQSAAHQFDCPGVMSELYGVTNWDFDFRGHKMAGDWQAALGITVRVHHLNWTTMAGEAKRDYPAPIGYQSPWYKEYSYIENYFARLNTALTRGKADVRVGVIHPIETYWLYWGTKEHTEGIRKDLDDRFLQIVKWLLYGLIDFDFISEALLPSLCPIEEGKWNSPAFKVGAMEYEVIIVPNCVTLRRSTVERLLAFINIGGKVIITGRTPKLCDALSNDFIESLLKRSTYIDFTENDLLTELSSYRSIDIRDQQGIRTDNMLYQMRKDGNNKWLFLAHSEKPTNPDIPKVEKLTIKMNGLWKPSKYDALNGNVSSVVYDHVDGKTYLIEEIYEQDSILYYLEPLINEGEQTEAGTGMSENHSEFGDKHSVTKENRNDVTDMVNTIGMKNYEKASIQTISYPAKVTVTLSEPNVLLLDVAEFRFDYEEWNAQEEILRIDNLFRERLGYPMRTEAFAQPWLDMAKVEKNHKLSLRFHIHAECEVSAPKLALENALETTVIVNGSLIPSIVTGWYTDRDIHTIDLPDLPRGETILEVMIPYNSKQNIEYMYLLGDFSVFVAGRTTSISKPIRELAFGDICSQGLPFYGGNVTYEIPIETDGGELVLEATQYRCPIIKVWVDSKMVGYIAFSPYQLRVGDISRGKHVIRMTAFGNRHNTFGPIHNCNNTEFWIGPNTWRSTGSSWSYEYQLKKTGILISPNISVINKGNN